ncbi:MAG TPA: hypothetical protein VIY48_07705 [Candidatus Paceibacterota bacterium]
MVIDTSALTGWVQSKTTISSIAAVLVYLAGVNGWFGLDYAVAVQISTALAGLAAVFMRNGIAKLEVLVKDIPEIPVEPAVEEKAKK